MSNLDKWRERLTSAVLSISCELVPTSAAALEVNWRKVGHIHAHSLHYSPAQDRTAEGGIRNKEMTVKSHSLLKKIHVCVYTQYKSLLNKIINFFQKGKKKIKRTDPKLLNGSVHCYKKISILNKCCCFLPFIQESLKKVLHTPKNIKQ